MIESLVWFPPSSLPLVKVFGVCSVLGHAIGSLTLTTVPTPFSLSTSIVPPLNSMLRRAIGRPRPVPVVLVEK